MKKKKERNVDCTRTNIINKSPTLYLHIGRPKRVLVERKLKRSLCRVKSPPSSRFLLFFFKMT